MSNKVTENIAVLKKTEFLGKNLTVFGTVAMPLFLAKEVADLLEIKQASVMVANVDNEDKVVNNVHTLGGIQSAWFLTEYGLYEVLMQSRKPIAKQFKKGVKAVLKEIRQKGYYGNSTSQIMREFELRLEHDAELNKKNETIIYYIKRVTDFAKKFVDECERADKLETELKELKEKHKKIKQLLRNSRKKVKAL